MAKLITPHFTLDEFTASQTAARLGLGNLPTTPQEAANITRTAETMERVRTILGARPILVSSGYRSPAVNAAVGGATSSAHMSGLAVDFTCPGFGDPIEICHELVPHLDELGVDQLIHEFDSWVHLGLSSGEPRRMVLTINSGGTRQGLA